MKAFDHALLVVGCATSLLGGVATAELGLAPIHQTLAAEMGPSLDTMDPDAPKPTQADLAGDEQVAPPATIKPVSVPARPPGAGDIVDDPPPGADGRRADGEQARQGVTEDLSLEFEPARGAYAEARDAEQDRDPAIPAPDSPLADPSPVSPG